MTVQPTAELSVFYQAGQVLATLPQEAEMTVAGLEILFDGEELTAARQLSPVEHVLILLGVLCEEAWAEEAPPCLTEQAQTLIESLHARLDDLSEEEREAFYLKLWDSLPILQTEVEGVPRQAAVLGESVLSEEGSILRFVLFYDERTASWQVSEAVEQMDSQPDK